jgi:hypothetical protein
VTGDGVRDLVVSSIATNSLWLLRGTGSGSFQAATSLPVGSQPHAVAIADVDKDGIPDLVSADFGGGTVSVLRGTGGGEFAAAKPFAAGSKPVAVVARDLDGDGYPDLVVTNFNAATASVLLNDGSGQFPQRASYAVGATPTGIAVGDVNHDGHPDLVVANQHDNTVSVLLGNGSGGFAAAQTFGVGVGYKPYGVAIADLNGDGNPDVAVANSGGKADTDTCKIRTGPAGGVSVLLGDGSGSFTPAASYASLNDACGVVPGDVNGDGKLDLVVPGGRTAIVETYLNATP